MQLQFLLWFILFCAAICESKGDNSTQNCILNIGTNSLRQVLISDVKIIQLDLNFKDAESLKPNTSVAVGWFIPTRWFIVRADRTNRLLLLFYYYYGFFFPYIVVTMEKLEVLVTPTTTCFNNVTSSNTIDLIRSELLNILDLLSDDLVYSDDQVCSKYIKDEFGFGVLTYKCCNVIHDEVTCVDVEEDGWVWTLRIFIVCFSIFIFLYFPKCIPRTHRKKLFIFYPTKPIAIDIVKTAQQDKYQQSGNIVPFSSQEQMPNIHATLNNMHSDMVYTAQIDNVELLLQREQVLSDTDQAVSFWNILYNMFIRFKIRNVDALQETCHAPICGSAIMGGNKTLLLHTCLSRLRTLIIYCVIVIPALPLIFILSTDVTKHHELVEYVNSHGLHQTSSFGLSLLAGRIITGIVCSLFVLHVVMVIFVDNFQEELIQILESGDTESRDRKSDSSGIRLTKLLTKYGVLMLPAILVLLVLSPLILILYLIFNAPVFKILLRQFKKLCTRQNVLANITGTTWGPRLSSLLFLTLLSVFVILTIGINFLLHCFCMIIVNVLINLTFSMSILSIAVLIVVYIRDSANRLSSKYNDYHKILLKQIVALKHDAVMEETRKTCVTHKSIAFQVESDDVKSELDSFAHKTHTQDQEAEAVWDLKRGFLRMRITGLVLFLDKHDVPYIPKKFFKRMTCIDCPGCPGPLCLSMYRTLKGLCGIGVFLFFLFTLLMAYGETISVNPTSRFFATIATGLIPLALRSAFFDKGATPTIDTSNLRFRYNFLQHVLEFSKKWPIADCTMKDLSCQAGYNAPYAFSLWKQNEDKDEPDGIPSVDLAFDMRKSRTSGWSNCCRGSVIGEGVV